jgi:hypothetical protein
MARRRRLACGALAGGAALLLAAGIARADLIQDTPFIVDMQGTGLGAVSTVLTLQSPANTTTEAGSVSRQADPANPGQGIEVREGDFLPGTSQTQLQTFASADISSAADLRVVFNAAEPAGSDITLENLVLSIFSPAGDTLFSSGVFSPLPLDPTQPGIGNAGFVFRLDGTQAAAAQAVYAPDNYIGLLAALSDATGGPETFFIFDINGDGLPPGQVPEPGTAMLAGLALLGLGAALRARRRS